MDYVLVNVTAPEDQGIRIGRVLVEEGLAACVNVVRGIRSIYRWKGNVEEDEEALLIIKTTRPALDRLVRRVKELHPYEVPEIIAMPIIAGNEDYLRWIEESVYGKGGAEQ
ncbi:dihydroorotate dehydrogenase [Thermocladium modestius]|uniref:Dihydroorotate dehydrogenase n=1 Tax=Thermocladium modestius TaxID=62609 RepID=A0A830GSA7_9CREN|nr:divalent-cation tolerance protein CutA [Thermocladium modestius]GGP19433.1 dihydroorotate dehydrogenase [Thermocladium modestius]